MRKSTLVAVTLAASVLSLMVGVQAQKAASAPAKVATLTPLDYIEIQQLNNKYPWALDNCTNNGYDYADLYTPDGVFGDTDGARWEGRDKLAEAAGGGPRGCKKLQRPAEKPLWVHLIENLVIEPAPGGAIGKCYLVYPLEHSVGFDANHSGHVGGYQDIYEKTPKGWRFKSRYHVFAPHIPGSYVIPTDAKPSTGRQSQPAR